MLETKQVGRWTVSQAGMREAVRRMRLLTDLQDRYERKKITDEDLTVLSVYPNLAGCVSPSLSEDEYLATPEQELDALTQAAMELNPHWFAIPDQEKKTEPLPPTSTEN